MSDVHLALDECPVNEPIVVYGTGFYAGDVIRFVSKEAGIDEKVETVSSLSRGGGPGCEVDPSRRLYR